MKVRVRCSQTVWYNYIVDVPDTVDVEEYVYEFLQDCDEHNPEGYDAEIDEYDEPTVEDIEEIRS